MEGSLVCSQCGQTLEAFKHDGLLGCAACYPAFAAELTRIFKRLHGATQHHMDAPPKAAETVATLEALLRDAVAREDYEEASALRDRILVIKSTSP